MMDYISSLAQMWPKPLLEIYPDAFPFSFEYVKLFLKVLLLEGPFYFFFLRHELKWGKRAFALFFCNLTTHPFLCLYAIHWFAQTQVTYGVFVGVAEFLIPVLEMLILHFAFKASWKNSATAGFAGNIFSWIFGGWFQFLGWI